MKDESGSKLNQYNQQILRSITKTIVALYFLIND